MKTFFGICIIVIFVFVYFVSAQNDGDSTSHQSSEDKTTIALKGATLRVDVLDTHSARVQGLSGRTSLGADEGVLFIFDESGHHGIWMRGMNFSIDIIWVDESFTIIDIAHDVSPDTFPTVFEPRMPALFVVETNSGFAALHNIQIGDTLSIPETLQ